MAGRRTNAEHFFMLPNGDGGITMSCDRVDCHWSAELPRFVTLAQVERVAAKHVHKVA